MLNLSKKYDSLRVVCDQIGTPTYTLDLSRLLVDMAQTEKYGYYHATNEGGYISWYDFTCEIFRQAEYTTKVLPVTTEEYGLSKAARPFNSRLCKNKLTGNPCVAHSDEWMCNGCSTCEKVCPYGAITYQDKEFRMPDRTVKVRRVASVNEAVCQGCGACTVACMSGAMDLKGFTNRQIMAEVDAICK